MTHGLVHADDSSPGYGRRRSGSGFVYLDRRGKPIRSRSTIDRLKSLAIPPAWTDVWICPDRRGHIQATGRDAKGRKQYRYHPLWNETQNSTKFGSLLEFGHALPSLRTHVDDDMRAHALSAERVVATTVWLLDHTLIRIGNREYSDTSVGLTTLRDRHVQPGSGAVRLRFVGKSGRQHDVTIDDQRVARVIRRCRDLPGQRLLQYVDGDTVRAVESRDVNDYIRTVTGADFTAKTFRTWGASAFAAGALAAIGPSSSATRADADVREVVRSAAELLRNTPAVCRNSYIHPAVIDAHASGALHEVTPSRRHTKQLDLDERRLLALLESL